MSGGSSPDVPKKLKGLGGDHVPADKPKKLKGLGGDQSRDQEPVNTPVHLNINIKRIFRRIIVYLFVLIAILMATCIYAVGYYHDDNINKIDYVAPDVAPDVTPVIVSAVVPDVAVETETPVENSMGKFDYYAALNDKEKNVYDQVSNMLLNFETKIAVQEISVSEMNRVIYAVQADHPEYFWVGTFYYLSNRLSENLIEIDAEYPYELTEKDRRQAKIDAVYDAFIVGMPGSLDDYGKVKYVYDYVVRNTDYVVNPPEDQNIYSVFGNNQSVCAGYAKSTQYLLKRIGIDCSYVTGEAIGLGPHGWNIVGIDGEYYYLDATWGELSVTASSEPEKNISYEFFCVTTAVLLKTHIIDETVIQYPELTATAANYFVREKKIFDLSKKAEQIRLTNDVETAKSNGEKYYHFKLEDQGTLNTSGNLIADVIGSFTWYETENTLSKTVVLY